MSDTPTRDAVLNALKAVIDPDLEREPGVVRRNEDLA